ncbi:hypothetical protein [Pseudomonas sp. TSRC2-2]|uniref:hypothetical protein n=1 Tax=unclassified Pseudomonas TaxID=196821 RepID=UPI003CE81F7D
MNSQWKLVPVEPTQSILDAMTTERKKGNGVLQMWFEAMAAAPALPQTDAQPVMKLEAEKLWGGQGEYAVSFVRAGWLDECRAIGGEFLLYTHPDEGKVARLTAERDALQLLLNERDERLHSLEQSRRAEFDNGRVAEKRNEELSGMLQHLVDNPYRFTDAYRERIAAALNPKPEVDNQRTIDALKEAGFLGLKT